LSHEKGKKVKGQLNYDVFLTYAMFNIADS